MWKGTKRHPYTRHANGKTKFFKPKVCIVTFFNVDSWLYEINP